MLIYKAQQTPDLSVHSSHLRIQSIKSSCHRSSPELTSVHLIWLMTESCFDHTISRPIQFDLSSSHCLSASHLKWSHLLTSRLLSRVSSFMIISCCSYTRVTHWHTKCKSPHLMLQHLISQWGKSSHLTSMHGRSFNPPPRVGVPSDST